MDEVEEKKSATEILIDVNNKVKLLLGYYKNMDNNIKLILSKMNSEVKEVAKPKELAEVKGVSNSNSETIVIPKRNGLVSLEGQQLNNNVSSNQKTETLNSQKVQTDNRTFSITQTVQKADGSPIKLAGIEIKDLDGNTLHQTRAQTNGKYIIPNITAGSYKLRVFKLNGSKGKVEFISDLKISPPESGNVVELSSLIVPQD
jgi:hypothetical protein